MQILALRSEQARMHGYEDYAAYSTADTMASTPAKVMELLEVRMCTHRVYAHTYHATVYTYHVSIGRVCKH
jgi:Zn-dependent oligopeptidase